MAQFARPTSIVSAGGWTGAFTDIDEAVSSPNDADKMVSPSAPAGAVNEIQLGTVTDPGVDTGFKVRARLQKDVTGGAQINGKVGLYQTSTLIEEFTSGLTNIGNGFVTFEFNVSAAAAANITDFAALRVRVTATQV